MSTIDEAMNYMADFAASTKFDTETITPQWTSTTAGSAYAVRWGRVVTLKVSNPTKLANGNNTCFTLPNGWRPLSYEQTIILGHPGQSDATTSNLRLSVNPNGNVYIYNYKGSAISGNTNATVSLTYICNRELGGGNE